jgi:thioredoxin 1
MEVTTAEELTAVLESTVTPVAVALSASWCVPCQKLRGTLKKAADQYSADTIQIVYVDADKNKELQKYLMGGYPTVRTFKDGELKGHYFVGSKSLGQVLDFLDKVITSPDADHPAYCPVPAPNRCGSTVPRDKNQARNCG